MRKVLQTAVVVVTALSIVGLSGTSAFAATDPAMTDPTDAMTTTTNTTTDPSAGGGDATNEACNTTVVIINNGGDPAQGNTGTQTGNECPPVTTPVTPEPETPGMGGGTPETPATPATPAAPVAMTLPDTGASALGNVVSTVMTLVTAAGGMFIAAFRTVRG